MKAVVVGAGAAGTAAALALAAGGASVSVVDGGAGATGMCSGAWEIAAATGGSAGFDESIADRVRALAASTPTHPYARVKDAVAAIAAAHDGVWGVLEGYPAIDLTTTGRRIATGDAVVRRVATHDCLVLDLDRVASRLIAVATQSGVRDLEGGRLARALARAPGAADLRFVDVPIEYLGRRSDALLASHERAALGDAADARRRLAAVLRRALPLSAPHGWLLPPLLGLHHDASRAPLEEEVGAPVGELAVHGAGPQGARLARRLAEARARADVSDVLSRATGPGTHAGVTLEDGNVLDADVVILATGSALAGGLRPEGPALREPLTGLRVPTGGLGSIGPSAVSLAAGVSWDTRFRPLDQDGAPVRDALFVCGSLLEGVSHGDGAGLGTAVMTGWLAGQSALAG